MNVITLLLNLVHSFTLLNQNIHKLLYVRSSSQRKVAVVNNSCWYVICHPSVGDWRINWRTYSALNWLSLKYKLRRIFSPSSKQTCLGEASSSISYDVFAVSSSTDSASSTSSPPSTVWCPVYLPSSLGQMERMNLTMHNGMQTRLRLPNTPYSVLTKHRYKTLRLWLLLIELLRTDSWPVRASWWSKTKHGLHRQSRQMDMVGAVRCGEDCGELWATWGGIAKFFKP